MKLPETHLHQNPFNVLLLRTAVWQTDGRIYIYNKTKFAFLLRIFIVEVERLDPSSLGWPSCGSHRNGPSPSPSSAEALEIRPQNLRKM
jgi:hypothetical protein